VPGWQSIAIRTVVLLAASFPGEPETQIRNLLRRHIDEAVSAEWPAMAKRAVSLKVAPPALAEALRLALTLSPESEGQILARNEIVRELENAMHARGTHQPQPVNRELGQVDLHVRAGRLCAGHDRFDPQRQSRRGCDRDGELCNRSGCIRASNRQPRPTLQR
jgi:hypothetical protein